MRVWVYPEKNYEELGASRYQVSWEEVKPSAKDKDEIDPDTDIIYRFQNFTTKVPAVELAKKLVNEYKTAYGAASVVRQIVDWYVEEDRVAEWVNTSEEEHFD